MKTQDYSAKMITLTHYELKNIFAKCFSVENANGFRMFDRNGEQIPFGEIRIELTFSSPVCERDVPK